MSFGLGAEIVLFANGFKKGSKDGDVGGILGLADFETLFRMTAPILDTGRAHLFENGFFGLGEVDDPGMSGVDVVGFTEVEGTSHGWCERESGLNADEKSMMGMGELGKGIEGGFKGSEGVSGVFESRAVGAEKIVAEWSGFQNGEDGELGGVKTEGLFAFEVEIFFPRGGLKKMLHIVIISLIGMRVFCQLSHATCA